jgi:hypothetical protein
MPAGTCVPAPVLGNRREVSGSAGPSPDASVSGLPSRGSPLPDCPVRKQQFPTTATSTHDANHLDPSRSLLHLIKVRIFQ